MAKLQAALSDTHTEALDLYVKTVELTKTDAIKQWIESLPTYQIIIANKIKELN